MKLPYLPEGKQILRAPMDSVFMQEAKAYAQENSLDIKHPTGAVLVLNGVIIGRGANGSDFHMNNGCERKKQNIPTGQQYNLCDGCSPKNHAEQQAIASATDVTNGADMYLWGHWWCCESCWNAMIKAGIRDVYLPEDASKYFKKN